MKFMLPIDLEPIEICSLLVSAQEGDISPWMGKVYQTDVEKALFQAEAPFYGDNNFFDKNLNPNLSFRITYDDPEDEEGTFKGEKTISWGDIETGLALLAEKNPNTFADLLTGNADALTADVYWQLVIFGEIIYA